ncbi:MAG: chemotaxis protein CheX [Deltaproteobacteria bacterium]|nr:chemotaxis protein CheX [Deltaproteobacteria bacterium]
MTDIDTLDLETFITNSVYEVFDTMLSMGVQISDRGLYVESDGKRIVGSVGFAGKLMGNVSVHVNEGFARLITAAMLGMEPDEIEGEDEIYDVIGELSNMIGGDLKSRFCDADLTCELSIPSITSGSDFMMETKGWTRHESFVFQNEEDLALVEVFIKSEN